MRVPLLVAVALISIPLISTPAAAQQANGQIAGNFRLMSAEGKIVSLNQFRGKPVVLEWNNPGCPFVQKHYDSGNMQATQRKAVEAGAVWLTINSGAPGKQGHLDPSGAKAFVRANKAYPTAYLLDPQGRVGKGYAAKTTPHLYLIDAGGRLVYQGAIDDKPTADKADIVGARNHLLAALGEVKAGKKVSVAETRPYGCSVKYAG